MVIIGIIVGVLTTINPNKSVKPTRDSISYDMYRGINVQTQELEPLYVDTNRNIYNSPTVIDSIAYCDTVLVNNTNHCVVNTTDDDISNTHKAIVGVFIKRVKFADEGADNK